MPVFAKDNQKPISNNNQKTDKQLPSCGSLSWKNIASDSALEGTTGVECQKLQGDQWQQIDGKLTEKYTGDKLINVQGKHAETIRGDRHITVSSGNMEHSVPSGSVKDQIGMNHEESVGMSYKLESTKQDFQASALVNIVGGLVKINS